MRLLVVEDEPKTGNYLQQGLGEAGFQVSLARNGLDGHHLAMTEDFDQVIIDVRSGWPRWSTTCCGWPSPTTG